MGRFYRQKQIMQNELMKQRLEEMDYLKSIFILLMIVFHLVYIGDKYPYAKLIVYTFHMSGFLVISGYLAMTNLKKDITSFAKKQLWIVIPYAIMETGYVVMSHILPVRESVPEITPTVLLNKIFINPLGPYWYLHTLLICSILQYCAFRFARLNAMAHLILFGLSLFAAAYWGGLIAFANAIYFLAGSIIKKSQLSFTHIFQPSLLAIIPLTVLCCFPHNLDRGTLAGVAITYLTICILLYIHKYLPTNVRQCFYFVGRNTLVIFLFSPIFTILSKLFLSFLLVEPSGMLFMVVAVIATVSGSLAMAWGMDKLHISRFFFGKKIIIA